MSQQNHEQSILQRLRSIGMENRDLPAHKDLPRASVLVPLFYKDDEIYVLLTQRPMKLKTHPGEVCFPGGRQDPEDGGDDIVTAFRETEEEVGLKKASFQLLCRLETVVSRNGLCVTPVVALWLPRHDEDKNIFSHLKISEDEVEAAFTVPLSYFLEENGNLSEKAEIPWSRGKFIMRTYFYQEEDEKKKIRTFKIWGLTAHIVHEVASIAANRTKRKGITMNYTGKSKETQGDLWLWDEEGEYWKRRHFFLTKNNVLHHYSSSQEASHSSSATKKNRLIMNSVSVKIITNEESNRYPFDVSVLDGRITWRLAADSAGSRQNWIQALENHNVKGEH